MSITACTPVLGGTQMRLRELGLGGQIDGAGEGIL